MKILVAIETLGRGGAEQALVNLLPALERRGHLCEVAVLFPPYDLSAKLEDAGIVIHRLSLSHRWNLWQGVRKISGLCRRGRFDIVHGNLFFAELYTALSRPFAPSPRRVVTFHDLEYESYPAKSLWEKTRKALASWLMRNWIDGRVAVSHAVARHYQAHLGLGSIAIIPNAFLVNPPGEVGNVDHASVRLRFGALAEEFLIVTPGRLVHEKGHQFLLRALVLLGAKGLKPKAVIIGDGPLASQTAALIAALDLRNQVTLQEALPHDELMAVLAVADACVLPSTHEGFGLAAAEAMWMEKAVLATRVGGLTELVEDGVSGLLVPPQDPAALAEGIARLMGDAALRQRLGRAGHKRIEAHFGAGVVAERWEKFYQGLLDEARLHKG